MRASRERRRRGAVLVEIEIDARLLDRLVDLQMLSGISGLIGWRRVRRC
jgi:hypothetical protein